MAAKNTTVTYFLPSSLAVDLTPYSQSQPAASIKKQGDSTILSWYIGSVSINQSRTISFDISSQDPGTFTLGTAPDTSAIYVGCDDISGRADISPVTLKVNPPEPFSLAGSGIVRNKTIVSRSDTTHDVELTVTKDIQPNGKTPCPDCPQVKITLETPPMPCKADILFAIDKSGSMRDDVVGGPKGTKNFNVLNRELNLALGTLGLPNAKIAIVSWDDDNGAVDQGDIDTTLNPQWTSVGNVATTLGNYNFRTCKETDLTVYEVGLQKAMEVMKARIKQNLTDRLNCATKRFIIFITSPSEFKGLQPNSTLYSISETLNQSVGFQGIFPFYIGSDLTDYKLESQNLTTIAQLSGASGPVSLTAQNLTNAIQGRMECHPQKWIKNVTLIDTLYPYLKYNSANPSPSAVKHNKDGTTTLEWDIEHINSSYRWITTIDTSVQMKLPVDVTNNRAGFGGNISPDTPYSRVEFDWPALNCSAPKRIHNVTKLPEGELWITCGAPCQVTKVVTVPAPQQNATNTEMPKKQPGFEGLFSLLALITGGYLWKKH